MTENPLIDEFLNYLKFERHFSPHTAKCYAADLAQFCGFLRGDKAGARGGQSLAPPPQAVSARAAVSGHPARPGTTGTAVLSETDVGQKLRDVNRDPPRDLNAAIAQIVSHHEQVQDRVVSRGDINFKPVASLEYGTSRLGQAYPQSSVKWQLLLQG